MRLTQQVVGKILDGFAWREMVGHRLVGAMIQPHHVNGAAGQFGRLIADEGGDILDLTTIAIAIEGDGDERDARRSEAGEQPCLVFGNELRSEEHTSELQSLMRISYAVFCLKKKTG